MSSSTRRTLPLIGTILIFLCLAYTAGFGVYWLWDELEQSKRPEPMDVFWEAWDYVEQYFYGELPSPQERTYGAIQAALLLLDDPYTVFVEPQPRELERDRMRGSFGGIGIALWRDAEGRLALSPYPNSPAERAGVLEGDVLLAVDGEEITSATTVDDVRAWFHGDVDTPVTLTISRPPTPPFDLTIVRDEIQVPSVTWRVLDRAPDAGYIHIQSFTERTGDEIAAAIQELLQETGVSSLILDLRNNSGGLIDPAVATASQFLRDGLVLIEIRRDDQERTFPVQSGGIATDVPLAVLVNGGTASASEIVAGALQDQGRAPLIGEPTFGKGSVQLIYDLSDGSSLHVTSAIWLTPDQHQIDGRGLTPDIYVPYGDGTQDEQLERAVVYLEAQR
ncbi:MAG: S41 family peptidase [Chloroflexota bacterium]|nr:S41 family peptidase [Chloroflexota bacterium]